MRKVGSIIVVALLAGAPAIAADKLAFSPPASWVVAQPGPIDDGKIVDGAGRVLLRDEQIDLRPGRITRYVENVIKVLAPQGLALGAVAFAWDPTTQTVIVHKFEIRRGAQTIDVLKTGQTFTVLRRETNLENAVLDGQLTASLQPEGLQVGDVVDFAVSIVTQDPALGTHVENIGAGGWNGVPIAHAHFRAQWPDAIAMRIQPSGGLVVPKIARHEGLASIELAGTDLQPLILPKGAPVRFQIGRLLQMTDLASWRGLADLMAPLYAKAEVLPPNAALHTEIARIRATSTDPKKQAEAALALVQDRVRYVFIGLNDGGYVPADAEATWGRRFGDCKGKTVLLLALLHGLGIEAQPVVVNTQLGDGIDERLPSIAWFNHVIVRARISGRDYWLDGTRVGDRALDGIDTPFFHWGLPLVGGSDKLVAMVPPPFDRPQTDVAISIDASTGLTAPAPIHIERRTRGDEAVVDNLALANLAGDAHDRALREFFKQRYDFAEPKTVSTAFDPQARQLTLIMDGTTKMDWNDGWYEADHVWVGYKADFSRDPGPNRDAPFAVPFPGFTHVVETIKLPAGRGTFTITPGSDVDQTVAGIDYHRHARIEGDHFIVEQSDRSLMPEFPASQAPAAEATLKALAKKSVFLNRPAGYVDASNRVPRPVVAVQAAHQTDLSGRIEALLEQNKFDEALALLNWDIDLNPRDATALGWRVLVDLNRNDQIAAKSDLDRAIALEPNNRRVLLSRGAYDQSVDSNSDAVVAYSTVLKSYPNDWFALVRRGQAYLASRQDDLAFIDATEAQKVNAKIPDTYLLRADVYYRRDDQAGVIREAEALVSNNSDDAYAWSAAGSAYGAVGLKNEAFRCFSKALSIKPAAYTYLARYRTRSPTDTAGRSADIDEALKLDPSQEGALEAKADLFAGRGDLRAAVALWSMQLQTRPGNPEYLGHRGVIYAKLGDQHAAAEDFDAAHIGEKTADLLNNLCWMKATAGVALDRALQECDAAIALQPNTVSFRDSRALVLLRLGDIDQAIEEYGKVLVKEPRMIASLYGRALAEAKKGDKSASKRDATAASKIDPDIGARFASYGLTL